MDPFTGVLYVERAERLVRGARAVDRGCLVHGSGRHEVQLAIPAGQCGWTRDGSTVRLNVYLQYDTYVQQVCKVVSPKIMLDKRRMNGFDHNNVSCYVNLL